MGKYLGNYFVVGSLFLSAVSCAFAQEDLSDVEEKARGAHELAMSDVIYEQENFKALYYQNEQIIRLLKEIRDEMHSLNMRAAKDEPNA